MNGVPFVMASLASCFTLALYHVAAKRDLTLPDLAVRAAGDYDGPRFVRLVLELTSTLPADQLVVEVILVPPPG